MKGLRVTGRKRPSDGTVTEALASVIGACGTDEHLERLIDLVGALAPHDLITVTRYSASHTPEFIRHRRFSDEMVRRYLENYYVYDPFYAHWREQRQVGIMPLKKLTNGALKRGRYIAEFLAQSEICDEVGVLLADGGDWCLGIFLDRIERHFREAEIDRLGTYYPVLSALHDLDIKSKSPGFMRTGNPVAPGEKPRRKPTVPPDLWTELSSRERDLVELILAGHPTAVIADKLGITVGTTKNHRRRIYDKLDITTERELFLQFFQHHMA